MYQGQLDVPLSDQGREQARALRDRLHPLKFDHCYTSGLARARETAAILLDGRTCPVHATADLNEMSYGQWEGLTRPEIQLQFSRDWAAFLADREHQAPPAGESAVALERRVRSFAGTLSQHHTEGEVSLLIVAHGGPLRTLIVHYLNLANRDAHRLRIDNASLSIVEVYEDDAIISLFDDTSHLSPLKSPPDRQPVH